MVSHDLRNMLSTMVGYAELLNQQEAQSNPATIAKGYAQHLSCSGSKMNRLIGDLDVASIQAGKLAVSCDRGDVIPLVMEALDIFQQQITLSEQIASPLPSVSFDAPRNSASTGQSPQ